MGRPHGQNQFYEVFLLKFKWKLLKLLNLGDFSLPYQKPKIQEKETSVSILFRPQTSIFLFTLNEPNYKKHTTTIDREGAATAGNSAQAGSGSPNPKMTLLLVFNIFRNSTFYTNVDYVPSFILCNLVVGGSTSILEASRPFWRYPLGLDRIFEGLQFFLQKSNSKFSFNLYRFFWYPFGTGRW